MVNYRPLQKASSAENLHALVYVSKILVFRFTGRDPERHFRYQHPIFRQLPCTADFLVYQRIIMLKKFISCPIPVLPTSPKWQTGALQKYVGPTSENYPCKKEKHPATLLPQTCLQNITPCRGHSQNNRQS